MAGCIFWRDFETGLDGGRRIAVDYSSVRYHIEKRTRYTEAMDCFDKTVPWDPWSDEVPTVRNFRFCRKGMFMTGKVTP